MCCCGLPSFDGKGSGAPPFAQGGALGLFAVGARLWREACNDTCPRALIRCIGALFPPPTGPLAFYRGVAQVPICNWRPALCKFSLLFTAGPFKNCAVQELFLDWSWWRKYIDRFSELFSILKQKKDFELNKNWKIKYFETLLVSNQFRNGHTPRSTCHGR